MMKEFVAFLGAEDGAVTVDWVVLTAGVVGLGMLLLIPIGIAITGTTDNIAVTITSAQTTP
ncbi:MAG: hypothetical protein V4516_10640 [Pseudomonadota bacterium]